MCIESDKRDFEKKLEIMMGSMDLLERCVDRDIMQTLMDVVNEYWDYLSGSIAEAIDEIDGNEDKISDLMDEIDGKNKEIDRLEDRILELEDNRCEV